MAEGCAADCGVGNVDSRIQHVPQGWGDCFAASDPDALVRADKLILPGVESCDAGYSALAEEGAREVVKEFADSYFKRAEAAWDGGMPTNVECPKE